MQLDVTPLFHQFDLIHPLSDECKIMVMKALKPEKIQPRKKWLRDGDMCRKLAFVQSGLLTAYCRYKDQELSCQVIRPGGLCISARSFFEQEPSQFSIEAIHESKLLCLDVDSIRNIYRAHPDFRIITHAYLQKLLSSWEHFLPMPKILWQKDRILWAREYDPDLLDKIPGIYAASFFGMSRDTFYKLRRIYGEQFRPYGHFED